MKIIDFSLQVNYSDWMTATGWRIFVQTFVDRGVLLTKIKSMFNKSRRELIFFITNQGMIS
jgi:hypothetical protein